MADAFTVPRAKRAARQAATIAKAVRADRARAKVAPAPPRVDGQALRALPAEAGAEARVVEVPVNRKPWTQTGLRVAAGDRVTWLAWGRAWLMKPLGLGLTPNQTFRARVGDAPPEASHRDTFTFTADRDGELSVGSLFPGEWRDGEVKTDQVPHRAMRGSMAAVVVRWPDGADPEDELRGLADPSGLCAAEAQRLANPPGPPDGWTDHPLLPPTEIYAPSPDGIQATVAPRTVGIVRRPAEAPLTETLRLRWSWRLDELPSDLPEDTMLTHDYLSVALEFDDGQDLTWHWSSVLPAGFAYRCPLQHWRHRETHVVARSGKADLRRWVDEERPVLEDHQVAIGGPPPRRVVSAWLIGVGLFQGRGGTGSFGRIELVDGDDVVRVL